MHPFGHRRDSAKPSRKQHVQSWASYRGCYYKLDKPDVGLDALYLNDTNRDYGEIDPGTTPVECSADFLREKYTLDKGNDACFCFVMEDAQTHELLILGDGRRPVLCAFKNDDPMGRLRETLSAADLSFAVYIGVPTLKNGQILGVTPDNMIHVVYMKKVPRHLINVVPYVLQTSAGRSVDPFFYKPNPSPLNRDIVTAAHEGMERAQGWQRTALTGTLGTLSLGMFLNLGLSQRESIVQEVERKLTTKQQ